MMMMMRMDNMKIYPDDEVKVEQHDEQDGKYLINGCLTGRQTERLVQLDFVNN